MQLTFGDVYSDLNHFRFRWTDGTDNKPPPKGGGVNIMSSDFVTVLDGILAYNDEAWALKKEDPIVKAEIAQIGEYRARKAGEIMNTSRDGYYQHEKCVKDFRKAIGKMITLIVKFNNFHNVLL